ncbi:hypothetical protein [Streptomyces sp. NPDC050535]|uniref:hypothetical protein n=1 Tax=Streptomyces sp. NPDC050535 TaxID=3365626 RepID=UPI0037882198
MNPCLRLVPARARSHAPGPAHRLANANAIAIANANSRSTASADPASLHSGYRLIGMHERAQSAGGRLRTGHRPRGVFEVVAELPLCPLPLDESSKTESTSP